MTTILYTIETLQPVKIATQSSQSDVQSALDYLPGVTLRGALLSMYLRKDQVTIDLNTDLTERRRWLNGDIRFLNAYPLVDGMRAQPFPNHLFAAKAAMKLYESGETADLSVKSMFDQPLADDDKRVSYDGYLLGSGAQRARLSVKKKFYLHVSLKQPKNDLFRYEAIEPNQQFQAIIRNADSTLIQFVQSLINKELYIGGSRSSGYGRCRIVSVDLQEDYPSTQLTGGNSIFLYANSDWLLRDEFGFPTTEPDLQHFARLIGDKDLQLRMSQSAIQTTEIGGYVEKWKTSMPLVTGVRKGSIYACEIVSGSLDADKVAQLQRLGIGDRRLEGFGEIIVYDKQQLLIRSLSRADSASAKVVVRSGISSQNQEDDNRRLQLLLLRGRQIQLQRLTEENVLKLHGATKIGGKISPSQIGKLMQLAFSERLYVRAHANNPQVVELSKKNIENYFTHLVIRPDGKERINQSAQEMLKKIEVNKQPLIDFYQSFVNGGDNKTFQTYFVNVPGSEQLSPQEKYMQSLFLLELFMRYCLRVKKSGGART